MESIQLQENLDGIKEEKERLLNSLVEAEYVFLVFISEKDSHFVVYKFYSCIMIHIYSMHFNCISGARSCYGRRKLSLPVKQGPLLIRKLVRVRSRPWTPRFTGCRSDTLSWWSSRRRWYRKWRKQCQGNIKSCLTMFWLQVQNMNRMISRKMQPSIIIDINGIIYRRDTIVTRGDAQQKINKKVLTKGTFERQMGELRKKIKVTIQVRDGNSI